MKGARAAPEPVWAPDIVGFKAAKGEDAVATLREVAAEALACDREDSIRLESDRSVAGPTT